MTRKELADKAYEMIREDLCGEVKEKDIWKALAETDDEELWSFVYEPKVRRKLNAKLDY